MSQQIKLMEVVLSYPHLFTPRSVMGGKPKYSAAFILDVQRHAPTIHQIAEARKHLIASEFNGVEPPRNLPIKRGEEKYPDNPFYVGKIIVNANTDKDYPPFVVDASVEPIVEPHLVYPGCIVNGVVNMYAYKMQGSSGLTFGLTGVQFVRDGERLDNRPTAGEVFNPIEQEAWESTAEQDPGISDLI